ncbi:MAG: hypothetical protein GY716_22245 [bacterium]|nr:hypothetical protein [bacterium]
MRANPRNRVFLILGLVAGLLGAVAVGLAQTKQVEFNETGTHLISLPANILSPSITNAEDLLAEVPNSTFVSKFDPVTDAQRSWDGGSCTGGIEPGAGACSSACFCIDTTEGLAYFANVNNNGILVLTATDGETIIDMPGPGTTLTGSHMISLPFQTPLVTAEDLINDVNAAAGSNVVLSVARFNPGLDSFEAYTGASGINFPIVPGAGYRVQVSGDVTYTPPGGVVFDGLVNEALGLAEIEIVGGELVVSNIGSSGQDGFRVENPAFGGGSPSYIDQKLLEAAGVVHGEAGALGRIGGELVSFVYAQHEEWEELGIYTNRGIDTTGTNTATINVRSLAQLSGPAFGPPAIQEINITMAEVAGRIEIEPDFTNLSPTHVSYQLYDGGSPVGPEVTTGGVVTADDWPVRTSFSGYTWDTPLNVTLPGGNGTFLADSFEAIPVGSTVDILDVEAFEVRLRDIPDITVGDQAIFSCGSGNEGDPCDDGNACTTGEMCDANGACQPGTPVVCDDGLGCNGLETCDIAAGCQSGTPPNCSDGVSCTDDQCNEIGGGNTSCTHSPVHAFCNDGLFCTNNFCSATLDCQSTAVSCGDGDVCTADSCNEALNQCDNDPIPGCGGTVFTGVPAMRPPVTIALGVLMLLSVLWMVRSRLH